MYLLVVRKREGCYYCGTGKTVWREWRDSYTEIYPTKKALNKKIASRHYYAGNENEQYELRYYEVDESTCVTVRTKVVVEEVGR